MRRSRPHFAVVAAVTLALVAAVVLLGWGCIEAALWLARHTHHTHCGS